MSPSRGAALPAAMLAALGFAVVIAGSYALMRVQVRMTVYEARQAQAQAIAEAGLENALYQLSFKPGWKTGYNQKPFAGGYFTVSISTDLVPWVTSTGYSASIPIMGRAARTVKAKALFNGFYDFANSTYTLNWYLTAYDSMDSSNNNNDRPTCTIAQMQSLGPSSAPVSGCRFGAYVFANSTVFVSSSATNKVHLSGDASYAAVASTAPFSNAVMGQVTLAASSATVDIEDGSPYLAANDNLVPGRITPLSAYSTTTMILSVTSGDVEMTSGTYYFKGIVVTSSRTLYLELDNTSQEMKIYLAGNLRVDYRGRIDSTQSTNLTTDCRAGRATRGGCKAWNFHIYGQGGGTMTLSGYDTGTSGFGVQATQNLTYLDLFCPADDIVINQRMLGRAVGKSVTIKNPYGSGNTRPIFFFDINFGYTSSEGTRWTSDSWSESYYRP